MDILLINPLENLVQASSNGVNVIEKIYQGKATPESTRKLAKSVSQFLSQQSLNPEIIHDIELAVTEACSNVVLHAYADYKSPGEIEIYMYVDWQKIVIIISDWGKPFPGPTHEVLKFQPEDESGRGVYIISQLMDKYYFECTENKNKLILEKNLEEQVWKH